MKTRKLECSALMTMTALLYIVAEITCAYAWHLRLFGTTMFVYGVLASCNPSIISLRVRKYNMCLKFR